MGVIHILDDKLINKIAAGEVVERPAAVVKELIENSIDSGADQITITIGEGGKSRIKVHDNGCGMTKEDAVLSIHRHATSKIRDSEDLFRITTLGFRGEALASIAAVSHMRIITRTDKQIEGTQIDSEGSKIRSIKELGCNKGTIIEVSSLFYNTPARKKYMKSIRTEHNVIVDIVTRYSLANHGLFFRLYHDNKLIINSPKTTRFLDNIVFIYGSEVGKNLITINHDNSSAKIMGYISKPGMTRSDKSQQSIFINGRYVKSKAISNALYDGYHSMLFTQRHPIAVIFIEIDPKKIDVNVHPTKDVIRIENEENIYEAVKHAVRSALESANLAPSATIDSYSNISSTKQYPFSKEQQSVLIARDKESDTLIKTEEQTGEPETDKRTDTISEKYEQRIGAYRITGQLNRTYIIAENAEGLLLIDQHAAEERVNYELLMEEYRHKGIAAQKLVRPKIIELSPAEANVIKDNIRLLENTGFKVEDYGKNSFLIRTIPSILGRYYNDLIIDLIKELQSISTKKIENIKEERIIRFACRKSVKAGEELTKEQMQALMKKLEKAKQPFSCPHGRPTMINISIGELEKKFKRTG